MVRIIDQRILEGGVLWVRASGLSTDTKPTATIGQGSEFIESDTGDVYLFSEGENNPWGNPIGGNE